LGAEQLASRLDEGSDLNVTCWPQAVKQRLQDANLELRSGNRPGTTFEGTRMTAIVGVHGIWNRKDALAPDEAAITRYCGGSPDAFAA